MKSCKPVMTLKTILFALLLACATAAIPQSAWALCPPSGSPSPIDTAYQQAAAAAAGAKQSAFQKFWAGLPKTDVGQSYCGQQLITFFNNAYSDLAPIINGGFGDSGAIATAAAAGVGGMAGTFFGNLANQVCTSTVGSIIGSIDSSASNLARICLPASNFGFGGWVLGFNINGCSGSTQVQYTPNAGLAGVTVSSPYGGGSAWFPPQ